METQNRCFQVVSTYKDLDIRIPQRSTYYSAGYDLESAETVIIGGGEVVLVPTGLKVKIPYGEFLALYPRSSTASKYGITLANAVGVIDSDYYDNENNEGHIMVPLWNTSKLDYVVKKGDRIAQGIFQSFKATDDDYPKDIKRGGGFGSTGK